MALIRGLKGLFPCPICLVPHEKLNELGLTSLFELRNSGQHIAILQNKTLNKGQLEEALKAKSLRPIEVGHISSCRSPVHLSNWLSFVPHSLC